MERIFIDLLNQSFTAAGLIAAILLLRPLFKKAPRWMCCALWGLVALRLLCPFSIESALSVAPRTELVPRAIVYDASATPPIIPPLENEPSSPDTVSPTVEPSTAPSTAPSATPTTPPTPTVPTSPIAKTPIQAAVTAATWVWLCGASSLLFYALSSAVRLCTRLRTAVREERNVWLSEQVAAPFVMGVLRPRIYLPFGLSDAERALVLAHEQAHIARFDHIGKALGFFLLSVHWFNPLMWVAYWLLCRDMELACDERVTKAMDDEARRAYSSALLNYSIRRPFIAAVPLAFGAVGVKERVKHVLKYKRPTVWIVALAVVACALLTVGFMTVPKAEPAEPIAPPEDSTFHPTACVYLPEGSDLTPDEALRKEQAKVHIFGKKDQIGEKRRFQVGDWSIDNFFCQTMELGELPFDTKGYDDMRGWRVLDPDGNDTGYRFYFSGSDMVAFSNGDVPLWFAYFSAEDTCEYAYTMAPCNDLRDVMPLYSKLFDPVKPGEPLPEIDESKYITLTDVFEETTYKPVKRLYSTAEHKAAGLLSDQAVEIEVSADRFELRLEGTTHTLDVAYYHQGGLQAWENDPNAALFPDLSLFQNKLEFTVLDEYGYDTGYRLYRMDDELWFGRVTLDEYMDVKELEYLYVIQ